MTATPLRDDHSVVRWASASKVILDPDTLEIVGCQPTAFELRVGEPYLSTSWLEYYPGARLEKVTAAANGLAKSMRSRKTGKSSVNKKGAFAIGRAVSIRNACLSKGKEVQLNHLTGHPNKSYASVAGPFLDLDILQAMADAAWAETVPAKDVLT